MGKEGFNANIFGKCFPKPGRFDKRAVLGNLSKEASYLNIFGKGGILIYANIFGKCFPKPGRFDMREGAAD